MRSAVVVCVSLMFALPAQCIGPEQLKALKEAVSEMCSLPDRASDYLRIDGAAKVGTSVPIKLVKADLSGNATYEMVRGIPITLDKYKKEPRECAIEMVKLLLPAFHAPLPAKSEREDTVGLAKAGAADVRRALARITVSTSSVDCDKLARVRDMMSGSNDKFEDDAERMPSGRDAQFYKLERENIARYLEASTNRINTLAMERAKGKCGG